MNIRWEVIDTEGNPVGVLFKRVDRKFAPGDRLLLPPPAGRGTAWEVVGVTREGEQGGTLQVRSGEVVDDTLGRSAGDS